MSAGKGDTVELNLFVKGDSSLVCGLRDSWNLSRPGAWDKGSPTSH